MIDRGEAYLGLIQERLVVVVRVTGEGVPSLLSVGLLALGLDGRRCGVGVALELVSDVLYNITTP